MPKLNWKSLKLLFSVGSLLLLTMAWFATSHWASLVPTWVAYKDGFVMICSFYLITHAAADVGHHFASNGSPTKDDAETK